MGCCISLSGHRPPATAPPNSWNTACSANCQHVRESTFDSNPSANARACRRGSTRENRPAIPREPQGEHRHPTLGVYAANSGRHTIVS